MASMIRALERNHGPVLVICLGFGDMPAYQTEEGVIIERCKAYHPNMLKRAELFGEFVAHTLAAWHETIELCVFRDPWGGLPAVFGGLGFKTLFEVNALPSWELGYAYPLFRTRYALQHKIMAMEKACLDRCGRILTVSRVTAKALEEKGVCPTKITTLVNAASLPFFDASGSDKVPEDMARGRWIGYMGSLHPWQGVENAVRAFSLVAPGHPDVSVVIVTGGRKDRKKQIRKLIRKTGLEERVILKHPMPHKALAQVVKRCDFTLAPLQDTPRNTRQGCCPIKIVESMAAGVPVIASDLSVTRDLIAHCKDGWLVSPDRVRDLALAMDRLLGDEPLRKRLSNHAAETAKRRFHPEIIHGELSRCFDQNVSANS